MLITLNPSRTHRNGHVVIKTLQELDPRITVLVAAAGVRQTGLMDPVVALVVRSTRLDLEVPRTPGGETLAQITEVPISVIVSLSSNHLGMLF